MARAKTVTVFIDEKSEKNLESQGVAVQNILSAANQEFSRQRISINYDLNSVRIKKWVGIKKKWFEKISEVLGFPFDGQYPEVFVVTQKADEIRRKISRRAVREFSQNRPSVIILLTDYLKRGQGFALSKADLKINASSNQNNQDGTGLIIIGTQPAICPSGVTSKELLEGYVILLMHEQGHLYGLGHTRKMGTIMCPLSRYAGLSFNKYSRKKLQQKTLT